MRRRPPPARSHDRGPWHVRGDGIPPKERTRAGRNRRAEGGTRMSPTDAGARLRSGRAPGAYTPARRWTHKPSRRSLDLTAAGSADGMAQRARRFGPGPALLPSRRWTRAGHGHAWGPGPRRMAPRAVYRNRVPRTGTGRCAYALAAGHKPCCRDDTSASMVAGLASTGCAGHRHRPLAARATRPLHRPLPTSPSPPMAAGAAATIVEARAHPYHRRPRHTRGRGLPVPGCAPPSPQGHACCRRPGPAGFTPPGYRRAASSSHLRRGRRPLVVRPDRCGQAPRPRRCRGRRHLRRAGRGPRPPAH